MNKNYIQSWIDIAIEDLKVSQILYENKKYSNSFYHFQQASEKGLKAYAFMCKTYTSEKEAYNTGHYTLKVFIDSAKKRQKEIALLKDHELEKIIGSENLDEYSKNLESTSNSLPHKNEIFAYSNEILDEILKTISELSEYNFEFPKGFKEHLLEKMDLVFNLVYKINPEKADETRKEFNDLIKDDKQLNEFIESTKEHFNNTMIEIYYVIILYYSNLISHYHNNKTRYPEIDFNPLEYYNFSCPIIQKLPEFLEYLNLTLLQLKKWNDLIN
jgi:HEPN domain-containing protein